MSYSGLIRKRGSRVTVKRTSSTTTDSVGQSDRSWGTIATDFPIDIQELSQLKVQEIFGSDTDISLRGDIEPGSDIEVFDGLIVTAGFMLNSRFRVIEIRRPSPDVCFLGLRETEETFT